VGARRRNLRGYNAAVCGLLDAEDLQMDVSRDRCACEPTDEYISNGSKGDNAAFVSR
jgi:hypothetical protein